MSNPFADFDPGAGGAEGPFIAWTARGTLDGVIPARTFYLRDQNSKQVLEAFTTIGVVMDIHSAKSGWQRTEGVAGQAPEWRWNDSLNAFGPRPGDDWKKGFSIRCAIGGGKAAVWEQAGAAAFNTFQKLGERFKTQYHPGKLPRVRLTGSEMVTFARGSTVEPVLDIIDWVATPDCLKPEAARAAAPAPAPAPVPAAAPAPAPAPIVSESTPPPPDGEF